MRVLVVCTANICRSPVAARLLTSFLDRRRPVWARQVVVGSAGTNARPDQPAAPEMVEVADRWGLDLAGHRSRPLTPQLAGASDLVVTMEGRHRDLVSKLGPRLAARTFTITELVGLLAHVQVPEAARAGRMDALVAALQSARTRTAVTAPDVGDPGSDTLNWPRYGTQ